MPLIGRSFGRRAGLTIALAAAAGLAALGASPSCRREPTGERADGKTGKTRKTRKTEKPGRLISADPLHDFGRVLDGDSLRHDFTVTNAGPAPVRILRVERSPACAALSLPAAPLGPSEVTTLSVECATRNRPPRLADAILVHPDDGGAPLRLELRATIEPLLAFDSALVTLETTPGRPVSRFVRLVGPLAGRARPAVKDVGAAAGVRAQVAPPGDPRGPGLELTLAADRAGELADRVLVTTGLERPAELTLPYMVRLKSGIEVDPARPYFNLHDPSSRSLLLTVRSGRPDFRIRRVEITAGPFRAAVEGAGVRVSVDEARVPAGERGLLGTLVLTTNDRAEPRKEIQLFAMGALAPPPSPSP